MNKLQSTFLTIAILATTVFVVGAYSNPAPSQYDSAGNPKTGPAIVGVTTEGPSQVKTNNLSLQKTFFARGNAIFEDQVLLTGPVYGGKESAQTGDRVLSVGTPGETSLTSVFAINNVKTIAKLQTTAPAVLPAGTTKTVPVCSDVDGFVVLCGEAAQDVCTNIEGPQDVVPPGMTESGGICTTTPPPPVATSSLTGASLGDAKATALSMCQTANTTRGYFTNIDRNYPIENQYIYNDSAKLQPVRGGMLWFSLVYTEGGTPSPTRVAQIDNSGRIIRLVSCEQILKEPWLWD